jgi:hypothetical protein
MLLPKRENTGFKKEAHGKTNVRRACKNKHVFKALGNGRIKIIEGIENENDGK